MFDSAGAASEADDEDPDDDGEDLSELDADVDISLCQDPELLMWTLYSSPDIVWNILKNNAIDKTIQE